MKQLIGEFRWTPPGWLGRAGRKRAALTAGLLALLIAGGYAAYSYFDALPKPPRVVSTITPPAVTPIIDGKLVPAPLLVDFTVATDPNFPQDTVSSVARIDLIDKVITEGVALEPPLKGEWRWESGSRLRFTPAEDWPAGQQYTVRHDAGLFAPQLELATNRSAFTTPPFQASVDELVFYQDPVERSRRKVVASLSFTHPVDTASLARHAAFVIAKPGASAGGQAVAFDIQYDSHRRRAFLHSSPIAIAPQESFVTLRLDKGLKPAIGPSRFNELLSQDVRIPDSASYFRVTGTQTLIARNDDNEPVQNFTLEFTDDVTVEALQDKLSAYILPAKVTINGKTTSNKRWQSPREVTPDILAQAKRFAVQLNPVERGSSQVHSAAIDVPEGSSIYLGIVQGVTSQSGFEMTLPYDTVLRVPDYPREATIAQSGAVLALTGSHKLTLISRGVRTLRVEIGRLIDSEVNHLASQTNGDITNPYFNSYSFGADNLTERFTRFIDVNASHPRKANFASLDLTELLAGGGYYFVTVQGWDRAGNHAIGGSDSRFVLITDLGLMVKSNADSTQDVFVHSIASGKPLSGVSVSLLGKNGLPIIQRSTAADGHVALPSTRGYEREKEPAVFVVKNGPDSVFMPYARGERRLQYSRYDVGGQYQQQGGSADRLSALVFTDRGLYRPGDTANLAAIVKRTDWGTLDQLPLVLAVSDPRGNTALEKQIRLPSAGFFDEQFVTSATSPTGNYDATLYLLDDRGRRRALGSSRFKVEEFLPDRLRIRSSISGQSSKGWLRPDNLSVEVSLQNLFGTPAEARRVSGQMRLVPSAMTIAGFEDFVFDDPLREPRSGVQAVTIDLPAATTDADGIARLPLPLAQFDGGIYRAVVLTEGFEAGGGRSVKAQASAMLSPMDFLVGYKAGADLEFLPKASEQHVEFVAVNSDAEARALDDMQLSLVEERFVSALVKRTNGTWGYQSVRKELPVETRPLTLADSGSRVMLNTQAAGNFIVKMQDAGGLVYSRVRYTVAGDRNIAGNLERNAELGLAMNGASFAPGDTIQLEITAPYAGTGLITIERDRVYAHQWFTSNTTTSVQTIKVPAALEGNAYVNIAFIRALDSPAVLVSPLSYAVAPFSINRTARTVTIELDLPDAVRPGQNLDIEYTTSQPSRIVIYAVDEGIVQVAEYAMPSPLDHFLPKMALQVGTFQMADLILPEFDAYLRQAAPGGGEAGRLAGSNINPFKRRSEAPVVYWSGVLDAGPVAGRVTYPVPDYFNGELRVMAVAVADTAVGRQQQAATVRGPFVMSPNVLTAAAPGDEFDVTVGLANNVEGSGENARVALSVSLSGHLEIIGGQTMELAVAEGREGQALFRVRALDMPGSASLTFRAETGDEASSRTATLSVRPPVPYVTTVQSGSGTADPLPVTLERRLYDQFAHQPAAASVSPLVLADGLLQYLQGFPHACAEQIVSKVFPQIGFLGSADSAVDETAIRQAFASTVQSLRSRQTPEGGFRFWPGAQNPADFASVYIVHFFTDARELGLAVPPDMLRQGLGFLRQIAGRQTATLADARVRAYAIYVLTRNAEVTTNALTNLHQQLDAAQPDSWRKDIAAAYMAASYEMLQQSDAGRRLVSSYTLGHGDEMTQDFDTRLGRDAQYLYLLARHFPGQMDRIGDEALESLIKPVMQNRFNTLSSAYAVLALNAYTAATNDSSSARPELQIFAGTAAQPLSARSAFARSEVPVSVSQLSIAGSGSRTTFYSVAQSGFDQRPPDSAQAEGLEIFREFLNADGKPVTSAALGDELSVRLRLRSTGKPRTNVAAVDLLPGGFEVQADSVRSVGSGWSADYRDVREDRVVIYGSFGDRVTEIQYRVKLTTAGDFVVPSAYAGSMYDRSLQARSMPGRFTVNRLP